MTYIFEILAILGASAVVGVIKIFIDVALLKSENKRINARLRKIDDMKLEATLAEIKVELTHIRDLLERRGNET